MSLASDLVGRVKSALAGVSNPDYRAALELGITEYENGTNPNRLVYLLMLKRYPVSIREFVLSKSYLNMGTTIYPNVIDYLEDLNNPDGDRLGMKYYEAVYTGGIGTAKTTQALITTAYQIYLLSCFKSPHLALEQDQSSEILFIFQSLHGGVSRDVDYRRFRAMVEVSPYFTEVFPFRKDLESRLIFPHRIEVVPVSGEVTATIGQNVFGGLMDEVNFMDVIADSKRKVDGGLYDQAKELYNSLSSRRSSRFMQFGKMPGIFCLSSSKRYPGQFTDVKQEQSKKDPGIWYYDKVVWDVKGKHNFSGKWFKVFCGDFSRKPRILEDGDTVPDNDQHLVVSIPREYYNKFENDIYDALREIAGVSTLATVPYISSVESVAACFSKKYKSIFSRTECDFDKEGLELFVKNLEDPKQPRAVHIDLGLTSDAAGLVIGHVKEFVLSDDEDGTEAYMPLIRIDGSLRVKPPKNGEINFKRIRKIVTILKSMGVNIIWVSFDSYQSVDSIQILKSKGFRCGQVSMDKTSNPYDMTKTCILEGRLEIPEDNHLKREIIQLERTSKGKIDHPDIGSKDVADALAGVVHTLSTRPYIWAKHGVAPSAAFKQSMKKDSEDE